MSEIEFVDAPPPAPTGGPRVAGQSPFGVWLNSLREHPGRWAKYPERVASATARKARVGHGYGVKAGEFEVTQRNYDRVTQKGDTYARYVGQPAEAAS